MGHGERSNPIAKTFADLPRDVVLDGIGRVITPGTLVLFTGTQMMLQVTAVRPLDLDPSLKPGTKELVMEVRIPVEARVPLGNIYVLISPAEHQAAMDALKP